MNLNSLPEDFRDILSILKKHEVKYAVVGAWAMGAHGLPRATGDLDIFIEKSEDNARSMVRALVEFGVPSGEVDENYFAKDVIFRMVFQPFAWRISQ